MVDTVYEFINRSAKNHKDFSIDYYILAVTETISGLMVEKCVSAKQLADAAKISKKRVDRFLSKGEIDLHTLALLTYLLENW
jgi:hypothetical protein